MKLPTEIKVGGHRLKVRKTKFREDLIWGSYNRLDGIIEIATDVTKSQQATSLLHEILHACFAEANLRPTLRKHEERIVAGMEPLLYAVLRDNPEVVQFITKAK